MANETVGKMGINLDNLIKILAKALYSRDDVAIREILSNSIDSLTRKKALLPNSDDSGYRIVIDSNPQSGILAIQDTGVGMTREEIEKYLSVIGNSGTKAMREEIQDPELLKQLIGQFGIGLLSAFTIADRVEIITKSITAGPQDLGYSWTCDGHEEYILKEIPVDFYGTRTNLNINTQKIKVLQMEYIKDVVCTYGEFMPYPILNRWMEQLNAVNAPWHKDTKQVVIEDYYEYLRRKYGNELDQPLAVHPLRFKDNRMDLGGVLFIPKEREYFNHQLAVDLYVRRVLVRKNCPNILPEWVTFIGGIIDCSGLSMVMSREDVVRGDSAFTDFQRILENQILEFVKTIKSDQRTLRSVLLTHANALKVGCRIYKPLFDIMSDEIYFQCGEEFWNLGTYVERAKRREITDFRDSIFYSTLKDAQAQLQLSRLYRERKLDIINAYTEVDKFIIEAYAHEQGLKLVNVDDEGAGKFFIEERGDRWKILEEIFTLTDYPPFIPKVSRFKPIDVPAILIREELGGKNKETLEQLLADKSLPKQLHDLLKAVEERGAKDTRILYINADNTVIQQLLDVANLNFELAKIAAHEIYHNSLQFSGDTLDSHRLQHIYDFHNIFLNDALALAKETKKMEEQVSILKSAANPDVKSASDHGHQQAQIDMRTIFPDYNTKPKQVFIMMPFRQEHEWIYENFLRQLGQELDLEIVRIDRIDVRGRITDAIFQKILESGVLFALISDNNPNVMYELGLTHAYSKAWQTILLSNDRDKIPFDIKDYKVSKIPETPADAISVYNEWKSTVKGIVSKLLQQSNQ